VKIFRIILFLKKNYELGMLMKKILLSIILLPVFANAYQTAGELYDTCNAPTETIPQAMQKSHCIGYIQGIVDGLQVSFGINPETRFICFRSKGMSVDYQLELVSYYIKNDPSSRQESARGIISAAFQNTYPCKN
jgi:hypothetical protein